MFGIRTKIQRWQRYLTSSLFGPSTVRINPVGYLCNHDCPMCWRLSLSQSTRQELSKQARTALSLEQYKQLLNELPRGVREIEIVGGGEPLLFPHINELLREIRARNLAGSLITNGARLSPTIIATLVASSWQKVRISIHAASSKSYQAVNGRQDFEKIQTVIQQLVAARGRAVYPKIALLFVIQRDNLHEIEDFANLAQSLGVDEIQYDWLMSASPKALKLSDKQRQQVRARLSKLHRACQVQNNIERLLDQLAHHPNWGAKLSFQAYAQNRYCQIALDSLEIDDHGRILPCCIAYGTRYNYQWKQGSLWRIWQSMSPLRSRLYRGEFEPFCKGCTYNLDQR